MKSSILWTCALTLVLWTGAQATGQGKGQGKGQEHQQQLSALDKQLRHAQAKQLERQARLMRIRELAQQKGDAETVARVDKLIAKRVRRTRRPLRPSRSRRPRSTKPRPISRSPKRT